MTTKLQHGKAQFILHGSGYTLHVELEDTLLYLCKLQLIPWIGVLIEKLMLV
jgi:hypothetical protein